MVCNWLVLVERIAIRYPRESLCRGCERSSIVKTTLIWIKWIVIAVAAVVFAVLWLYFLGYLFELLLTNGVIPLRSFLTGG